MAGGIGVACMHNPRSSQERNMNADGVIERRSAPTAVGAIGHRGNHGDRLPDEQDGVIISSE